MIDTDERSGSVPLDDARRRVIRDFSEVIDIISREMVQVASRELAGDGLTLLQYHALRAIWTSGPALDMSSIGAATGLTASSLTSIVDRLAERGLVERHHDAKDRRRIVATITADGVELMERMKARDLERLANLLESSSTEDLATTLEVFRALHARMQDIYDSAGQQTRQPSGTS
jgi:DNA-binding MarR family transcriptional regulator